MTKQLSSLILCVVVSSCFKDQPRWIRDDPQNFKPDSFQLELCTLDNLKLKTTRSELLREWGQPTRQIDGGGTFYGVDIRGKVRYDSTVWFAAYYYKNVRFAVWENHAVIETVDFRNSDTQIKGPGFSLSANTNLDYIRRIFPSSHAWRNMGINTARDRLFDSQKSESNVDLVWVDLQNESGQNVELTFVDNKLAFLINIVVR